MIAIVLMVCVCVLLGERLVMREWMAVIDAAIMGAPEQVKRRKETISKAFAEKYKDRVWTVTHTCTLVYGILSGFFNS